VNRIQYLIILYLVPHIM